jgi:hypothetical protein
MDKETLERFIEIEKRVSRLEQGNCVTPEQKTLELDITLPSADIDGLRFNETKVSAVFDLKEDGWWHSRDILFVSARNAEDDNSRDILTEYLESAEFRDAVAVSLIGRYKPSIGNIYTANDIDVSMPVESETAKMYNGAFAQHWLKGPVSSSCFYGVSNHGEKTYYGAGIIGGVAPMFRIKEAV